MSALSLDSICAAEVAVLYELFNIVANPWPENYPP